MENKATHKVSRSRQETRVIWTTILENCRQLYKSNVSKKVIRTFYRHQIEEYRVGKNAFRYVEKYITKPTAIIYSDVMEFLKETKSNGSKKMNDVRDLFPETIRTPKSIINAEINKVSSLRKKIKIENMLSIMDANDISIIDIFKYYEEKLQKITDKYGKTSNKPNTEKSILR